MLIDPDELIPAADVATMLRVQTGTLTQWRCAGRGPAFVRCGRAIFYRREDVREFLGRLRRDPASTQNPNSKTGAGRSAVPAA